MRAMNLGIILLFLQFVSMTDGHIIIYGTGGDSPRPELKWDGESGNLEREIGDVKESLVSVNQQIGDLKNRVEELQNSVEERTRKCPDAWIPHNDSCFFFDSIPVNFITAESFCKGHNAHLVHLETREKNAYLQSIIPEIYKDKKDYMVWIGMTDAAKEGVWKTTGTKLFPSSTG
ncbi:C-type lectin domain family 10 member A-like isoform X2 [Ruditapes philippinarum]|uniref:C-type lectin domain family 10 member A-like isoform X2 n=1 Tax=Ruditapes philippinarum TaxID=129788 RepID=UPI00295A8BB8|nr:C-type lectin domain family 10 member A-like isoform X2 [Ruditapes philippinarum]